MKTNNYKLDMALVNRVCPICGKVNESASEIIIGEKMVKTDDTEIQKLHGKTIGFSEKPCKECQEWIDKGALFIIGIDAEKSDDMSNPYRTGHLVGIKRESEFVKHLPEEYQKKDAIFMDYKEMKQLGMIEE